MPYLKLTKNFYEHYQFTGTKEVTGDLQLTNRQCANGEGVVMELGFKLDTKTFLKTFESCYNTTTASAIYSVHQIYGKIIQRKELINTEYFLNDPQEKIISQKLMSFYSSMFWD